MAVYMSGLRRMHAVMRAASDYKAHFPITRNGIDFDCLFLVDATPYEFVLAAIGHPDVALFVHPFELTVLATAQRIV